MNEPTERKAATTADILSLSAQSGERADALRAPGEVSRPIQPDYITRFGQPVCPDCRRSRCVCHFRARHD